MSTPTTEARRALSPRYKLEAIQARLHSIVAARQFTGSVTIHFRAGCPRSVKVESCHGDDDGWSFPEGP